MTPTNTGDSVRLVRERAEHDVLHPGADVRGERAQVDEAEGAVLPGRARAAGDEDAIAFEDRVLHVLEDGVITSKQLGHIE